MKCRSNYAKSTESTTDVNKRKQTTDKNYFVWQKLTCNRVTSATFIQAQLKKSSKNLFFKDENLY